MKSHCLVGVVAVVAAVCVACDDSRQVVPPATLQASLTATERPEPPPGWRTERLQRVVDALRGPYGAGLLPSTKQTHAERLTTLEIQDALQRQENHRFAFIATFCDVYRTKDGLRATFKADVFDAETTVILNLNSSQKGSFSRALERSPDERDFAIVARIDAVHLSAVSLLIGEKDAIEVVEHDPRNLERDGRPVITGTLLAPE